MKDAMYIIFLGIIIVAYPLVMADVELNFPVVEPYYYERDLATDCQIFPCYTAPHKEWVSLKYVTRKR